MAVNAAAVTAFHLKGRALDPNWTFWVFLQKGTQRMVDTRITASEFQQAFGALSDKARRQPVIITRHGRDSLVVMAAEGWERLKRRDRRVGLAADLPPEWIEAVRSAHVPDGPRRRRRRVK